MNKWFKFVYKAIFFIMFLGNKIPVWADFKDISSNNLNQAIDVAKSRLQVLQQFEVIEQWRAGSSSTLNLQQAANLAMSLEPELRKLRRQIYLERQYIQNEKKNLYSEDCISLISNHFQMITFSKNFFTTVGGFLQARTTNQNKLTEIVNTKVSISTGIGNSAEVKSNNQLTGENLLRQIRVQLILTLQFAYLQFIIDGNELGIGPLSEKPMSCIFQNRSELIKSIQTLNAKLTDLYWKTFGFLGLQQRFQLINKASAAVVQFHENQIQDFFPELILQFIVGGYVQSLFRSGSTLLKIGILGSNVAIGGLVGMQVGQSFSDQMRISILGMHEWHELIRSLLSNRDDIYLLTINWMQKMDEAWSESILQGRKQLLDKYSFISTGIRKYGSLQNLQSKLNDQLQSIQSELARRK